MKKNKSMYISLLAHEATVATLERHIKRQWIALIVAIVALITSNVTWFLCADGKDNTCSKVITIRSEAALPLTNISSTLGARYDIKKKAGNRYT